MTTTEAQCDGGDRKENERVEATAQCDDGDNDSTIDDDLLHAAEHHKGRSAAFTHLENVDTNATDIATQSSSIPPKAISIVGLLLVAGITIFCFPSDLRFDVEPTIHHVWYYGWITAVSTGFGVIPLILVPHFDKYWIGISNALAAGMMIAASYSLIIEGFEFSDPIHDNCVYSSTSRTVFGVFLGLAFILVTKRFLESHEDLKVGELSAANARKVILIMFVMTLHSFAEGVGIGVSFGGTHGKELGFFISASLAAHNIPEGLAVSIVLIPQKMSKMNIALWCIMTSIPQPIMAVPAYLFVHKFILILPIGLGFAGGAMAWVAFAELLLEAIEDTDSMMVTAAISTTSLSGMLFLQNLLKT